jgi:hypothetical protein
MFLRAEFGDSTTEDKTITTLFLKPASSVAKKSGFAALKRQSRQS